MKRIILILLSAALMGTASAQMANQVNYKSLEKKIAKSNLEIKNEKKSINYKTWLKRGELMLDVYDAMTYSANNEMSMKDFNLIIGSPKSKSIEEIEGEEFEIYVMERTNFFFKDNSLVYWNYTNPLYANPLNEAYQNFQKVMQLDNNNKSTKEQKKLLDKLKYQYITEGSMAYAKKDYAKSYDYFVKAIEIGELPVVNFVDTVMIYYSGLSAQLNKKYEEATTMYKKAIEYKSYMDGNVFYNLFDAYNSMDKASEGLPFLEQGFVQFPKNQNILYSLIRYYLEKGENPEVIIEYIDQAIQTGENASLYFAKGTLYDKLENFDEAIVCYNKSIELKPEFFDAAYNLAAIYFNKGVKFLEEANKVPAREEKKYLDLIEKSNVEFKMSIPYMENALKIEPSNLQTLESLKNLYFRYRNESDEFMKKYEEVNVKIKELKE